MTITSKTIAPAVGVTREAIARIVAPEAFAADYQHYFPDRSTLEQFEAYKKADAILALSPAPDATVSAEPVAFQWRTRKPTFPPRADPWSYVDYHTGLLIKRHPEKYEVRALYASPQDVGREATVGEMLLVRKAAQKNGGTDQIASIVRQAAIDTLYSGAGKVINPEIFDDAANAIRSLAANGGGRE